MSLLPKFVTLKELAYMIKIKLISMKAPDYDLITGRLNKELPRKELVLLTVIFNALLGVGYFSTQWKVSDIILIQKPGKTPNDVISYRPISLLLVGLLGQILDKIILRKLTTLLLGKINTFSIMSLA